MFQFENSHILFFLGILPVLVLLFFWAQRSRKRAFRRFGHLPLMKQLMPQFSQYKHSVKFALLMLSLALLITAWANPQLGTKKEKVERKSVSIFIALDVSKSMNAEDLAPNRMERAKRLALEIVRKLRTERLGLIIFAGNAYLQTPLTDDYAAMAIYLNSANTDMVSNQGTAISSAIEMAQQSFEVENKANKALIILTDGETHDEGAIAQAKAARAEGILTFTIGVGTADGSPIPMNYQGNRDYKYDETGNIVISKLNEDMLRELASAGDGNYYRLGGPESAILDDLQAKIDRMEKQSFEQRVFEEYESYYQIPLGLAILVILVEFIISYRKNRYLADKDLFRE
jgi:Ca-activated chloride channel family protein